MIAEAAAFHDGVVVVQVNEIVDTLPRVDIPGDWVDVIVSADRPFYPPVGRRARALVRQPGDAGAYRDLDDEASPEMSAGLRARPADRTRIV